MCSRILMLDCKHKLEAGVLLLEQDIQKRKEEVFGGISDVEVMDNADRGIKSQHITSIFIDQNRFNSEISEYRKALGRIYNGTFGICLKCGGDIEEVRLKILPETQVCSKCSGIKQS